MLSTVKKLVTTIHQENENLREEVKRLKQLLQYRHTTISDLRFAKKELEKVVELTK